jgi:hypothetical protein
MSDQEEEHVEDVASEQTDVEQNEQQEQKMVPLAALEAERKKRQETEAKAQLYQDYLMRAKQEVQEKPEEDDPNSLIEKGYYTQDKQLTKREILEQVYQDVNPKAVQEINKYLKPILEQKPWLAQSVDSALNRYARAYEIVNDYKHLVEPTTTRKPAISDGARIVQNAQKPRSPAELGKTAQLSGKDYLKSIQGKAEFREYRQKVRRGEI